MDTLNEYLTTRPPTAERPLLGLTVLVVEDSLFACEAIRLLCLHSGARIRRADSLAHARRHLAIYRPAVVIVDLGLPDGSGADLIAELHKARPRVDVVLATSGDPENESIALLAGADGYMPKPISSIAAFQSAILAHLPQDRQPPGPRNLPSGIVTPDDLTYREDLAHVAQSLSGEEEDDALAYITQFLGGVARSAGDADLCEAVDAVSERRRSGGALRADVARLAALVQDRLSPRPGI
jgi:two-component system, OmpR family, response regulator